MPSVAPMEPHAADVRARLGDSAAAAASRAYEAAYGSPISSEARGVRWRLDWRVAATVVVLLLAVGVVAWAAAQYGNPAPVVAAQTAADPEVATTVVVHVAGAVAQPGLVELDPTARVGDAVAAAGGMTRKADPGGVNLARRVVDGEQIFVPRKKGGGAGLINVNHASATELEQLPGIGPALAARIVADRKAHGPFARLDDLKRVSGIGNAVVSGLAGVATA